MIPARISMRPTPNDVSSFSNCISNFLNDTPSFLNNIDVFAMCIFTLMKSYLVSDR